MSNDTTKFLGCTIINIKKAENMPTIQDHTSSSTIVVSTCFFISSDFNINDKTFTYVDELIANIESFQMKIDRFTTNPTNWIYRVYIDDTLFKLKDIIDTLPGKLEQVNKNNTNIKSIIENITTHKKKLLYIYSLLTTYITKITNKPTDAKYKQIELYTYSNNIMKSKLISDPDYVISGHTATFGTLLRFHPLTDNRIGYCIMRNCSNNLSPLDIMIQNYWITENTHKYMEYNVYSYTFFSLNKNNLTILYNRIYKNNKNTNYESKKYNYYNNRFGAGLISVKIDKTDSIAYNERFKIFEKAYIEEQSTNTNTTNTNTTNTTTNKIKKYNVSNTMYNHKSLLNKYIYGIDELIIKTIFPDMFILDKKSKDNQTEKEIEKKNYSIIFSINFSSTEVNTCLTSDCNDEKENICAFSNSLTKKDFNSVNPSIKSCNLFNFLVDHIKFAALIKPSVKPSVDPSVDPQKKQFTIRKLPTLQLSKKSDRYESMKKDIKDLNTLHTNYIKIYNYIGTYYCNYINTYPINMTKNNLPLMSILKSFDYKFKYKFYFDFNFYNIPELNQYVSCMLIKLKLDDDDAIKNSVATYMTELAKAFSLENFKPLIIYPIQFELNNDGVKLTIHDLISKLSKHNLTFELENALKTTSTHISPQVKTIPNSVPQFVSGGFSISKSTKYKNLTNNKNINKNNKLTKKYKIYKKLTKYKNKKF